MIFDTPRHETGADDPSRLFSSPACTGKVQCWGGGRGGEQPIPSPGVCALVGTVLHVQSFLPQVLYARNRLVPLHPAPPPPPNDTLVPFQNSMLVPKIEHHTLFARLRHALPSRPSKPLKPPKPGPLEWWASFPR